MSQNSKSSESPICNKCGERCYGEGLLNQTVTGGYFSHSMGDMNSDRFSLCEGCLWEIFQTFKTPPVFVDHLECSYTYAEWQKQQPLHKKRMTSDPCWQQKAEYFVNEHPKDGDSSDSVDAGKATTKDR